MRTKTKKLTKKEQHILYLGLLKQFDEALILVDRIYHDIQRLQTVLITFASNTRLNSLDEIKKLKEKKNEIQKRKDRS